MTELKKRLIPDLVIVICFPILASFIAFYTKAGYFWSILLFFGLPSLYLSIREPKFIKKSFIFSLVASIPTIVAVDIIGQRVYQWIIPHSISSIRMFGIVPIEQLFWAFFNFYAVIIFYEYFLDRHFQKRLWAHNFKYVLIITLALIGPVVIACFIRPDWLNIPYFYLIMGLSIILVPTVLELFSRPKLIPKFFQTAAFFFYLSFVYEFTALKLDYWRFPSNQFIGWVSLSDVKFPLEELIFWLFLFAMAILSVYEKFDDDGINNEIE